VSDSDPRLNLLERLAEVAEAQVEAARTFKPRSLSEQNTRFQDLQFELSAYLQEPLPEDPAVRVAMRAAVKRLRSAQARLADLSGSVLRAVDTLTPRTRPKVYTRGGRLT
jgi:hypothetical protein